MTTGRYVLVLVQRVLLVVAVAVLTAGVSVFLGRGDVPVYTSSATYSVGPAEVSAEASVAEAAQTARVTLPSLAQVAVAGEVLTRAEEQLDAAPGSLTGAVTATVPERDLSFLTITVTGPDPATAHGRAVAVGEALQEAARDLNGGAVSVALVTPPREPRFPSSAGHRYRALLGAAAGTAGASLVVGLLEAARPRFRSRRDLTAPGVPVVVHQHRWSRRAEDDVDRLTQRLTWVLPATEAGRVADLAGVPSRRPPAMTTVPTSEGDVLLVQAGRAALADVEARAVDAAAVVLVAGRAVRWADAAADRVRHLLGDRRTDRRRFFAALVPAATLLVVAVDPKLPGNLNAAAVVTVALAPVWLPHTSRFRGARALLWLGAFALASGTVLAMTTGADHDWSRTEATGQALLVVGALGTVGVVCWARDVMPSWCIPAILGIGILIGSVPAIPATVNPVKFILVFPLSLILLGLCDAWGRLWPVLGVCLVLALLVVANDGRSGMAFLMATAAIMVWQATRTGRRALNRVGTVIAVVATGTAGYVLATDLLVSGVLGESIAQRSQVQIDQSGSLLLGGRPEWSGTVQLMAERPVGFGLGTVPNGSDVIAIKQGFESLRIPTADGYIEHYLTAGRFELHSVVADLWVWLGVPGLVLGVVAAGLVLWGLVDRVAAARAHASTVFLGLNALWFLAFGPLPSNVREVSICLGLCLVPAASAVRAATRPAEALRSPVQPVVSR